VQADRRAVGLPGQWRRTALRWQRLNARKKPVVEGAPVPDANEEYLIYQTLLGMWPLGETRAQDFPRLLEQWSATITKTVRALSPHSSCSCSSALTPGRPRTRSSAW
jgi:(1->4)-alpha-D-glucan 1-alpha-D-glucosylmutase